MRLLLPLLLTLGAVIAASQSELPLLRTITLEGNTHHVQGIVVDGRRLWVTSVGKEEHKGYLQEFDLATGKHLRTAALERGDRYHPGGMSSDGASLWIPVAEYRRASTSVIQKRSVRTLALEHEFEVPDHIGCVAVTPTELIGANWDARDFYFWNHQGQLLRKLANPTPNGYQDLKYVDGRLIASGLLPGRGSAIDWLDPATLRLLRRLPLGNTTRGVPFTNEGMAVRGQDLYLLPEDAPSRLFQFRLPR